MLDEKFASKLITLVTFNIAISTFNDFNTNFFIRVWVDFERWLVWLVRILNSKFNIIAVSARRKQIAAKFYYL